MRHTSRSIEILTKLKVVILTSIVLSFFSVSSFADYVDLDGANLIANDLADGTTIDKGKILLSEKPGLGICMK